MTGQHTILVVEDSPTLAATYQAQLEPMGQKIVVASDGTVF